MVFGTTNVPVDICKEDTRDNAAPVQVVVVGVIKVGSCCTAWDVEVSVAVSTNNLEDAEAVGAGEGSGIVIAPPKGILFPLSFLSSSSSSSLSSSLIEAKAYAVEESDAVKAAEESEAMEAAEDAL